MTSRPTQPTGFRFAAARLRRNLLCFTISPEARADRLDKGDKLDKDKDGLLTAKEFPQQRPDQNFTSKPAEQSGLFMRVDENKDGKITFDELALKAPKYTREQFDRMDANKDGAISRQEMVAYGAGQKKDPNQMTASAKPDATASALNSPQQLLRKADANKDAVVSFEEMKAVAPNMTRERFDAMDKNKDGNLSTADRGGADSDNKSAMAENMQKLMESDSDKDGTLTFEELAAADRHGVNVGIGTDVGAGTTLSVLHTLGEAYRTCQLRGSNLDPFRALHLATAGGARVIGIGDKVGGLLPGQEADFIVLEDQATPLLARRCHGASLHDRLFALQVLGDDRAISATYLRGRKV